MSNYEIDLSQLFNEVALVFTAMFRLVKEIPKSKYKCQNCVRTYITSLHQNFRKIRQITTVKIKTKQFDGKFLENSI